MELLQDLQRHGLNVVLLADDSVGVFPKDRLTDELRKSIKEHKEEIVRSLKQQALTPAKNLTPSLERRLTSWGCRNCSWFLGDGENVCIVEDKRVTHMLTVARLRDCPKRNKQIYYAILRGDHLMWLN